MATDRILMCAWLSQYQRIAQHQRAMGAHSNEWCDGTRLEVTPTSDSTQSKQEFDMFSAQKAFGGLACCILLIGSGVLVFASDAAGAPDKYSVKVPGGLGFSEFRGYESWETISVSYNGRVIALTVGNPEMINAYKAGFPANGKAIPDGAKMAKVHWTPKPNEFFPDAMVPGVQHDVDFMVKDSKRFADGGGWGYAYFLYDAASDSFRPATSTDTPPQNNDAKCGVGCHTLVKSKDYVFTEYGHR